MALQIPRIVLHQVDHIAETLTLSNLATTVNPSTMLALGRQIANNQHHRHAQKFVFDPGGTENPVREAAAAIFAQPHEERVFIGQSSRIATDLFEAIRGNKTVSVGDLLVCLFHEDTDDPWLGILKMQPESAYIRRVEGSSATRDLRVVLEVNEQTLTSGLLQKCAFILSPSARTDDHELTVVDQQVDPRAERKVAAFFVKDFLNCRVAPTRREMTRMFLKGAREYARQPDTPDTTRDAVIEALAHVEYAPQLDVEAFAAEYVPPEQLPTFLATVEAQGLPTLVFQPAPPQRHANDYVYFEGDDGLQVRINRDAVGPGKTLYREEQTEGGKTRVTILTTIWQETAASR